MKWFPVFGGPGDGRKVGLEFPYRAFYLEEDGTVRHGASDGARYEIRSVTVFDKLFFFAVHDSILKLNPLETWVMGTLEMAYMGLMNVDD